MDDAVRVLEGDALDLLRQLPPRSVDAIVTDPPYSSGGLSLHERQQDPLDKYVSTHGHDWEDATFDGDQRDQRSWTAWTTLWLLAALPALRRGARCYVFSDWRQLPSLTDAVQAAGLIWRGVVVWDKGGGARAPHTGYHRHQCEYIVFATRGAVGRAEGLGGPFPGCIPCHIEHERVHPTGKPVELLGHLVRTVQPGCLVLDPFAGSGSTGVAALRAGRRALLIESDPHWCDVARRRVEAASRQVRLSL